MREYIRNLALKLVGCPYIWGGKNPWVGFDCSGFVCWVYQCFGLLDSSERNAQGLYEYFEAESSLWPCDAWLGCMVFYGRNDLQISHVMLGLGNGLCIGASGGDHTTTTIEDARRRGASVKVKPINYRSDVIACSDLTPYLDAAPPAAKAAP